MPHPDAPPVRDWLKRQDATTRDVLTRSRNIHLINQRLYAQWSHEPWIDQIRVANLRGTTIVVFSQTAAAMVPLRYKKQLLLDWLLREFRLRCTDLEVKVVPTH